MAGALSYEETLRILRRTLVEAEGQAWAFLVRSRGQPRLLSSRGWAELGEIEALLVQQIGEVLRRELRVEPWVGFMLVRARAGGVRLALGGERRAAERLYSAASRAPVEEWRAGAPQLEPMLWPFLTSRTRYLANTLALALDRPAPFPALIWHPGRREFSS